MSRSPVTGASTEAERRPWITVGAAVALGGLALVFSLVRQPGSALDAPWAEDGTTFLQTAYRLPWRHAVLQSYNGYVSLYPSVVAVLAAHAPVRWAAVVLAIGGALSTALAVVLTVLATRDHLPSAGLRLLLGLAVGAFPLAGQEIAASSCNAHWYLLLATFWCLLWRPKTLPARLLIMVVPFVAAASDPLAGLLLPVALLRLFGARRPWSTRPADDRRRARRPSIAGAAGVAGVARIAGVGGVGVVADQLPGLGLLAGLCLQAPSLLRPSLAPVAVHPGPLPLLEGWVYRVLELALLGPGLAERAGWTGFAAAIVVVVGCAVLAWHGGRGTVAVAALVTSALTYAVPTYLRWVPAYGVFSRFEFQTRYCFVPWALTLFAVAVSIQTLLDRGRAPRSGPAPGPGSRPAARVAVALLAVVIVVPAALGADQGRPRVPSWRGQAAAERANCRATLARPGQQHADKVLEVPPRAGDVVAVPCRRLIRG